MAPGASLSDVVGTTADTVTVAAGVVAFLAAAGTLSGRNLLVHAVLRRTRRRTVGRALKRCGLRRAAIRRGVRQIVGARLGGDTPWTVPSELHWLDQMLGRAFAPVTFLGAGPGDRATSLDHLADAYLSLGSALRSRALITAQQATAVGREADLAEQTATVLQSFVTFEDAHGPAGFTAVLKRTDRIVELLDAPSDSPTSWPEAVALSHRAERIVPDLQSALARTRREGVTAVTLPTTEQERERLQSLVSGRQFDGVLPSLLAWRHERDVRSGHWRLHLAVRECTFSAVVLAGYGGEHGAGRSWSGRADQEGPASGLLTLSMMLVTTDGTLVAVRRPGPLGPHGGRWVPTVNGNLEARLRLGISADVDAFGLLDPVAAIVREAKEELGLTVSPRVVRCIGLARMHDEREWGVNTLCFLAPAGMTSEALRQAAVDADPVEGAYEVGDNLLLLPWTDPRTDAPRLARWAATANDVAPHLVACLAALAQGYGGVLPGPWTDPASGEALPSGAVLLPTAPR